MVHCNWFALSSVATVNTSCGTAEHLPMMARFIPQTPCIHLLSELSYPVLSNSNKSASGCVTPRVTPTSSSRIKFGAFRIVLAMATLCFSPPLNFNPRSPTIVLYPVKHIDRSHLAQRYNFITYRLRFSEEIVIFWEEYSFLNALFRQDNLCIFQVHVRIEWFYILWSLLSCCPRVHTHLRFQDLPMSNSRTFSMNSQTFNAQRYTHISEVEPLNSCTLID